MTCTVGLTLKPGESCHYAGGNDYFNFDFIFYVRPNGVGFTEVTLKTPSHTYNAPAAVRYGGSVTYSFSNELTLELLLNKSLNTWDQSVLFITHNQN